MSNTRNDPVRDYYELREMHEAYRRRQEQQSRPADNRQPVEVREPVARNVKPPQDTGDRYELPEDDEQAEGEQAYDDIYDDGDYDDERSGNPFAPIMRFFRNKRDDFDARRQAREEAELAALDDLSDEELAKLEVDIDESRHVSRRERRLAREHLSSNEPATEDEYTDEDSFDEGLDDRDYSDELLDDDELDDEDFDEEDGEHKGVFKRLLNLFIVREDEEDDSDEDYYDDEEYYDDFDDGAPETLENDETAGAVDYSRLKGEQSMNEHNQAPATGEANGMSRRERRELARRAAEEEAARKAAEAEAIRSAAEEAARKAEAEEEAARKAEEDEERRKEATRLAAAEEQRKVESVNSEATAEESSHAAAQASTDNPDALFEVDGPTREFTPVSKRELREAQQALFDETPVNADTLIHSDKSKENPLNEEETPSDEEVDDEDYDEEDYDEEDEQPRRGFFGRLLHGKDEDEYDYDDEDDYDEDEDYDEEEEEPKPRRGLFGRKSKSADEDDEDDEDDYDEDEDYDEEEEKPKPRRGLFGRKSKSTDKDDEDDEDDYDEDNDYGEEEEEPKPHRGLFGRKSKSADIDDEDDYDDEDYDEDEEEDEPKRLSLFGRRKPDDDDEYDDDEDDDYDDPYDEYDEYEDDEDDYDEDGEPRHSVWWHIVGVLKWSTRILCFLLVLVVVLNFLYVTGTDNIVPTMRDFMGEDSMAFRFFFFGYTVREQSQARIAAQREEQTTIPDDYSDGYQDEAAPVEPIIEVPSFDESEVGYNDDTATFADTGDEFMDDAGYPASDEGEAVQEGADMNWAADEQVPQADTATSVG